MAAADLNAVYLALRLRAKPALPTAREMENVPFTPPATAPYAEEDFVPATNRLISVTKTNGVAIMTGLYVLRWFGEAGVGTSAMNSGLTAVLALFPIGLGITATDGSVIIIGSYEGQNRGPNMGPQRGQIVNLDNGRPVCTVKIPFWLQSTNSF